MYKYQGNDYNFKYNTLTDVWTTILRPVPYNVYYHTAVAVGTDIYIMGGDTLSGNGMNNYKYNVLTDLWTAMTYVPYQAHNHVAVYTNNALLHKVAQSIRDWGRDCSCPSGMDNLCNHRYDNQYGELPYGYDHKYVYSHFGYNLKVSDMQAAVGVAQLKKIKKFVEKRKENSARIKAGLIKLSDKLILPEPCENSDPSWFGFLITCREGVDRNKLVQYIENHGIQTRMLFAGNLLKHPCFDEMRRTGEGYRVVGELKNTDRIMNDAFWIGVYPGMNDEMIDYMVDTIKNYFKENE
jgi:CDP-6-deoxy-D-xylo-4-hexulose-3-dehydrase